MDDDAVGMEVDPDIAAAMGFASFGSSKDSTKFGRGKAATDNYRPTDFGTDANRVELGPRKRQVDLDESTLQGADTTDLGPRKRRAEHHDVDPASKDAQPSDAPTESTHAETVTAQSGMKVTTPPRGDVPRHGEEVIQNQSSIAAKSPKKKKETVPTGLAAFLARGKGLPEKPPTASSNATRDLIQAGSSTAASSETLDAQIASANVEPSLQALKNGIRNENGDIAYFLPSFIEDPWAHLEKKLMVRANQ